MDDIKKVRGQNRSIHSLGLMDLVNMYNMNIKGYFIGIEVANIDIIFAPVYNDSAVKVIAIGDI